MNIFTLGSAFFVACLVLHVMSYIHIIFTGYVEVKCVYCSNIYLNIYNTLVDGKSEVLAFLLKPNH